MYKLTDRRLLSFLDFNQPMGLKMNPENRWIKMADRIPWDAFETKYVSLFPSGTGNVPAIIRNVYWQTRSTGQGKTGSIAGSMGCIVTKLEETKLASVALSVFVMNLFKIQKRILCTLFYVVGRDCRGGRPDSSLFPEWYIGWSKLKNMHQNKFYYETKPSG